MLDPTQTALLIMDYQAGTIGRLPGAEADALVERAAQAVALVRQRGGTIGYVRVAFTDADIPRIPDWHPFAAIVADAGAAYHADAPTTQIDARIAPRDGDVVVRKTRVGPFSTTDLDAQLRARGITTLLLGGISTSGVTLSAVRDAADRDYRLFVVSDLCADFDPEVHAVLTGKVFPRQATILQAADLGDQLG